MATFTGTGVSTATAPTVNGLTTVVLTNTSSFIGTVFFETSLDGGSTWPTPSTALTAGTMAAGPLTFTFNTPQLSGGLYQTAQHRLHCTTYTSGTLTYTVTEASVPAVSGTTTIGPSTSTGNVISSFANEVGTSTNDNAPVGMVGEYEALLMTQVAATGTVFTCPTASPAVLTLTAATGLVNLQAVNLTNSGGALPAGTAAATNYYITNLNGLTCNLSSTLALAAAGTPDINATVGTGTQTLHGACYLATTAASDIGGLALTAGDWDIDVLVFPGYGSSTSVTQWAIWVAQVGASALPTTAANVLAQGMTSSQVATANLNVAATWSIGGTIRVSLAAAGYLALAASATFTVSTLQPQALMRARRAR